MRKALVRDGVPPRDVFQDHAGFDTWDRMIRARRIFGIRRAVVGPAPPPGTPPAGSPGR